MSSETLNGLNVRWHYRRSLASRVTILTTLAVGLSVAFVAFAAFMTARMQMQSTLDQSLLDRAEKVATYDVPLNFYNTYSQGIEAVTQADVQRVAKQYIDPDKLAIVIVGDRKSIEATLKATNIGNVVVVDVTGRPAM